MIPEHIQWGRWRLDEDALVFRGSPEHPALEYVIKVDTLTTSHGVRGWIRQLEEKTWCTEQDLAHFVHAASALMMHQSTYGRVPSPPPVMTPWHSEWVNFLDQLREEIGLTYDEDDQAVAEECGHDPECPKAVDLMRKLDLDDAAIDRSLAYFRKHGGTCDCKIWLNVEASPGKQG